MNRHIRAVEVIDRTLPSLAPIFDEMRDRLHALGITKARYRHAVPLVEGARLEVSASPPIRALADDYVRNRRHEVDYDLFERMQLTEPRPWEPAGLVDASPASVRAKRRRWAIVVSEAIGDGWWHGFDVAVFGPRGRRGLFKINAPLEQPLSRGYMLGVRHVVQDFHLAFCHVELSGEQVRLRPQEREALAGVAIGLKAEVVGEALGITGRAVEERLARARKRLDCASTTQAVAKAITLGLIA